jgi:hypothetical protein
MTHTLGPWHCNAIAGQRITGDETSKDWDRLHINAANCTVARVYRPNDARLIAAAPDLLAACNAILDCDTPTEDMGGDWGTVEWEEQVGHAIALARAAIAKAVGEE